MDDDCERRWCASLPHYHTSWVVFKCPHEMRYDAYRTHLTEDGKALTTDYASFHGGPFDTIEDVGRWLAQEMLDSLVWLSHAGE